MPIFQQKIYYLIFAHFSPASSSLQQWHSPASAVTEVSVSFPPKSYTKLSFVSFMQNKDDGIFSFPPINMAIGSDQKVNFISAEKKKERDMPIPLPTLASIESLAIPLVQEVVFLADFRCANCQQRVAEVMSKMNGETDSVVVSVLEKKVTLTCRFPTAAQRSGITSSSTPVAPLNKLALLFMRLFFTTCRS